MKYYKHENHIMDLEVYSHIYKDIFASWMTPISFYTIEFKSKYKEFDITISFEKESDRDAEFEKIHEILKS